MPAWGKTFDGIHSIDALYMEAAKQEARGLGGRLHTLLIHGEYANLDTTRVTIQDQGGFTVRRTSAAPVDLFSSVLADDAAGTGARSVLVRGLGSDFTSGDSSKPFLEEIVPLDGTNVVSTTNDFLRVVQLLVVDAGVTGQNEGLIQASIGGDLQKQIGLSAGGVGHGISKSAQFAVPLGWSGFLPQILVTWGGNQGAEIYCAVTVGTAVDYVLTTQVPSTTLIPQEVIVFAGGSDAWCEALRVGGGGTDPIEIQARLLLIRDA